MTGEADKGEAGRDGEVAGLLSAAEGYRKLRRGEPVPDRQLEEVAFWMPRLADALRAMGTEHELSAREADLCGMDAKQYVRVRKSRQERTPQPVAIG